uniref:Uncharacterized protein n=1 Tax=Nelumbo nucifera TaxID=4432 RepID=A0A822YJ37_NELNU|nr:TPA_asm: hypothetical protein HUJ06_011388 [Nelumbo nucifera]
MIMLESNTFSHANYINIIPEYCGRECIKP